MAEWKESEHPRDNDGKFTDKGAGSSLTTKTPIQRVRMIFEARKVDKINGKSYNVSKDYKEPIQRIKDVAIQRRKSNSIKLPKIVMVRFNHRLAAINHGEYYKKTPDGNCSVVIDGDNGFLYNIKFTGDIANSKILGYKKIRYEKAGRDSLESKEINAKYDNE